ncbi:MAG: VOC family protein, partial [Sphingopyxis sp.]
PSNAVFTIAIGYWGDMQIELVRAENDGASIYTGEYAVTDRLHHVCVLVPSIDEARQRCIAAGAEILVEGSFGADGAVIYVDAGGGPGTVIEYLQPATGSDAVFAMVRDAARDWDGSDPVRTLG